MTQRTKWIIGIGVGILAIGLINSPHPTTKTPVSNGPTTYVGKPDTSDLTQKYDKFKESFMSGCMESGTQSECDCIWNGINAVSTKEEVIQGSVDYLNTGNLPSKWITVANNCVV